jgi:hypothetical protein
MFGAKKVGATTPSFGAKTTGTATAGGFGAKPAGTTGGFGAKPAGTATGATGGFGAKAAGTTTAIGGFGAKTAGTATGAAGTTTGAATGATGGFGAKAAGTTTGGFGAKAAGTTTTGGFGAKATGTATTTTTTGAATGTTTVGGFGRTAAGFGQVAGAAGTGTGTAGVGFGTGAAGSANLANNPDMASLIARITELGNRLHPQSPYCALKYIFYNRVDPQHVRYYRRPESFDPGLWAQALALNPDPEHLVPHQACGYPDLKARLDAQDSETGSQATALADAETFIRLKYEEHSLSTALKLDQLKRDSLLLSHRLLTVSSHIEILRARGLAIQPDEDAWRQQLHNLLLQLSKPNEYRGRLNELSSRVRMLQNQSQQPFDSSLSTSSSGTSGASSSDAFSETDLSNFTQFLQHQQSGLEHLIDILNADVKNLQSLSDCMFLLKRD